MKLDQDVGQLSRGGTVALFGALALCCVVPMLIAFGALSVTGAFFGGGAALVVGVIMAAGWVWWMRRHHRSGSEEEPTRSHDVPRGS